LTLKPNIKMYKKLFMLFAVSLVVVCLSSCRVQRQEIQKSVTDTELKTEIKETYRDTTLYTPKSETTLTIPIEEFRAFKQGLNGVSKTKVFTQRNGNATAKVTLSPEGVNVTSTCDSLAIVAKIKSELFKESINKLTDLETTNIKTTGYSFMNLLLAFLMGAVVGWFIQFNIKL